MGRIQDNRVLRDRQILPESARQKLYGRRRKRTRTVQSPAAHDEGIQQSERSDRVRIFGNIFDLDGADFAGVSLITGGFPCQPFSVAGKRRGAADDRAIWPQMFRVISEARPAWVLGENVPGIIPMELDNVLSDLEGIGYATRAFVIPACAVDARHRRDRVWMASNVAGRDRSARVTCAERTRTWFHRLRRSKRRNSTCIRRRVNFVSGCCPE